MSLPTERWCVSLKPRTKQIDAELKEKLAPAMATRSARFQFAYELAFAIVCGDNTNEIVRAMLRGWQGANLIKNSYGFPAPTPQAGKGSGPVKSRLEVGPLEFRVNRLVQAVLVPEEMAWRPPLSNGFYMARKVA